MTSRPGLPDRLTLATRNSPLALAQTHMVRAALEAAHPDLADRIHVDTMTTSGDRLLDRTLIEAGGKGLFTKELEIALLDGRADLAVHSTKDVPTQLPDGLGLAVYLPRADVRDCFVSPHAQHFDDLIEGATVGTASLRRRAFALHYRPDLRIVPIRGNVQTRLKKLHGGEADATFLARAGLDRMDMAGTATESLATDRFLPAPGQGAVVIETRVGDQQTRDLLAALHDPDTESAVTAERACLAALDGSCRTPIAAHSVLDGDSLALSAMILSIDGQTVFAASGSADRADATALGSEIGQKLRTQAGEGFFAQLNTDMMQLIASEA